MERSDAAKGRSSRPRATPRRSSGGRMRLPRLRTFDSFAYPDYRLLWMGNFFSNSAQWLQLLTVGWLMRGLTAGSSSSTLFVITVGGMSLLPGLLMAPIAGTLGDRLDRRKLVIGIQAFMAAFSFLFAVMVGQQLVTTWHAYIYVFVSGVCVSISQNSRMALVANTVPREALAHAFATNVLTIPGTRMIGPFIGGILITTLGFFWNFTLEALLYLGTILTFLPMKTPYQQRRRASANESFMSDLLAGFTYIWRDKRVLLYLTLLGFIPNTILQPVMFLLPVFTDEILRRGADVGGYFLAINGLGGLLMALFIASFGFVFRKGMIVLVTAIASSVIILLFSACIHTAAGVCADNAVRVQPVGVQDYKRHADAAAGVGRYAEPGYQPAALQHGRRYRVQLRYRMVRATDFGVHSAGGDGRFGGGAWARVLVYGAAAA